LQQQYFCYKTIGQSAAKFAGNRFIAKFETAVAIGAKAEVAIIADLM
jgi:hypothetical protein